MKQFLLWGALSVGLLSSCGNSGAGVRANDTATPNGTGGASNPGNQTMETSSGNSTGIDTMNRGNTATGTGTGGSGTSGGSGSGGSTQPTGGTRPPGGGQQ